MTFLQLVVLKCCITPYMVHPRRSAFTNCGKQLALRVLVVWCIQQEKTTSKQFEDPSPRGYEQMCDRTVESGGFTFQPLPNNAVALFFSSPQNLLFRLFGRTFPEAPPASSSCTKYADQARLLPPPRLASQPVTMSRPSSRKLSRPKTPVAAARSYDRPLPKQVISPHAGTCLEDLGTLTVSSGFA